ncbi:MAG: PAS domain S-box protein, partial [Lentimicrobium sp.]|nr:PAS domain S-box protein [Lentimicrobium sp.]
MPVEDLSVNDREIEILGDFIYYRPGFRQLTPDQPDSISFPIRLLESLPFPMFIKDLKGHYIAFNNHFSEIFGIPADKLIGKTIYSLYDKETAGIHISADEQMIKSGNRVIYKTMLESHDSENNTVLIIKSPLSDKEENLQGIIGLICELSGDQAIKIPGEGKNDNPEDFLKQRISELEEINNQFQQKINVLIESENEVSSYKDRLEIALNALNSGAWEWEPSSGSLVWTDKCYDIFGLEKELLSMQTWMSKVYSEDISRVKEMWSRITRQSGWFDMEFRITVNQMVRWIRKSGYYVAGTETNPAKVTGIMLDITDEKDFSNRLFNNQRLFKTIIDDQSELICRIRPDGTFTFINKAFARFFGDSVGNLLKKSLHQVFSEKDNLKINKQLKHISPSKEFKDFEQRFSHESGDINVIHWTIRAIFGKDKQPEEFQLVGRDVTEIEASREAIKRSEEMFRLIAENSNDIISIHSGDDSIEYVSPSVKFILGYSPDELIGGLVKELVYEEDLAMLSTCKDSIQEGKEPMLITLRLRNKQGELIWFESMLQQQHNSQGKVTGKVIAVSRNVHSRKLVEGQQKLTELQLKEANLTKDKFFSIIAHDLRSPFTSILGFTRLLSDEYDDFTDDERKMMLNQIQNSTESTFQLLDNLLAWAKTQLGRT